MVVGPGASSAAAISLSALFFAPVTRTRPVRAVPPVTSKHSTAVTLSGPHAGHRLARMVRLTRIYTKTGDAGQTHLGDMSRVAKTDPRLVAYADVDEANSALGVALALGAAGRRRSPTCCAASRTTCSTSAPTSAPRSTPDPEYPPLRVTAAYTERLEAACDEYNERCPS